MTNHFARSALMKNILTSLVVSFVLSSSSGYQCRGQTANYPPKIATDDIRERIAKCDRSHPRLFTTKNELKALASMVDSDPLRKQLADLVVHQANILQSEKPIERRLVGVRLLSVSTKCVQRVLILAMAYHLTHDVRHLDRCREEMLAAARFTDWHPEHFLDVAEMTFGLAVGYDLLYEQLDEAARREIRSAIVHNGLRVPFDTKFNAWVHRTNNWGQVCHGGLTAGALAVFDDEPDLAARTVQNALQNVPLAMAAYAPHGGYPEGPGYWNYGTTYNVFLIEMLGRVFGTDFGLSDAPGFNETGAYPALVCGPSNLYFNYADGSSHRKSEPIRFWFAARYHRPGWLNGEADLLRKELTAASTDTTIATSRFLPLAIFWMKNVPRNVNVKLPLSWSSGGTVPITVHRSSWSRPNATFVGLKGGSPGASHGQMDIGSFVVDCDGVRWAIDLGAEDYHRIESRNMDLWNRSQNSQRWTIFRLSNLGHNTLVIDNQLQDVSGNAPIIGFSDDRAHTYSIVDLSSVYHTQAASVKRGVQLLPSSEVLVQDELTGLHPGARVRWGMITTGEPDKLGGSVVRLRQASKELVFSIVSPGSEHWKQIETAKPPNEWDSPNPGTRMMVFEAAATDSGTLTLAVLATPGNCKESVARAISLNPLETWRVRP
jgi:hypothetical protein